MSVRKEETVEAPVVCRELPKMKRKPGASLDRLIPPASDHVRDLQVTKCSGILHGEGVLVINPEDLSALLHLGCYGKGIFSRSIPTHRRIPQLSEFRVRKKRAVTGTAPNDVMCTDPASQEWIDKLSQFEESQRVRLKLHKEWSREKEEEKRAGVTTEQKEVVTEGELSGLQSIDCLSDQVKAPDAPVEASIPPSTHVSQPGMTVEEHYHQFVKGIEALRKEDAFPLSEHLQLSSEETLYLTSELGVLNVTQPDGAPLTHTDLWEHFRSTESSTPERYTAYLYYRKKGWVPKCGLKFGVDFLLYKEGPAFYHSSYAVVVKLVEQVELGPDSVTKPRNTGLTWKEVIALNRVNESVGKELIICYVVKPKSFVEKDLKLESCVNQLVVREVFVKRWVPDKERNT